MQEEEETVDLQPPPRRGWPTRAVEPTSPRSPTLAYSPLEDEFPPLTLQQQARGKVVGVELLLLFKVYFCILIPNDPLTFLILGYLTTFLAKRLPLLGTKSLNWEILHCLQCKLYFYIDSVRTCDNF